MTKEQNGFVSAMSLAPCLVASRYGAALSRSPDAVSRSCRGATRESRLLGLLALHPGVGFHTVELRAAVGVANLCGLIERVRTKHGVLINSEMKPCLDRDGRPICLAHYFIEPGADAAHASAILAILDGCEG